MKNREERIIATACRGKYSNTSIIEALYLQLAEPYNKTYQHIQDTVHATEYYVHTGKDVDEAYRETKELYKQITEMQDRLKSLGKAVISLELVLGGDK